MVKNKVMGVLGELFKHSLLIEIEQESAFKMRTGVVTITHHLRWSNGALLTIDLTEVDADKLYKAFHDQRRAA